MKSKLALLTFLLGGVLEAFPETYFPLVSTRRGIDEKVPHEPLRQRTKATDLPMLETVDQIILFFASRPVVDEIATRGGPRVERIDRLKFKVTLDI